MKLNLFFFRLSIILLYATSTYGDSPQLNIDKFILKQGGFLTLSLTLPEEPTKLSGIFLGNQIKFFQLENPNKYYALVGVDLLDKPGVHPLTVNVKYPQKKGLSTTKLIFIQEGKFRKEKLRFGRKSDQEEEVKKRITREWHMMQKLLQTGENEKLWRGKFILPINSKITSKFGNQRIFNNELQTVHTGVDFRAPVKTPLKTPNDGIVSFVGELYYCGNTLLIDHGAGVFSQFCHLYDAKVKVGDKVKKGQIVARAGNTGRVTGPHLHWAVHMHSARISPMYLKNHSPSF